MNMPPTGGIDEAGRQQYAFEVAIGNYILGLQAGGDESIDLTELDPKLTRLFFNAGWAWGKEERPAACPECYSPTVKEADV